jgi:O-antigen/teichoic acid export membrane protein
MTIQKQLASAAALPNRHNINVALNVGGIAIPVLAGVLTIPTLVRHLGQEGFATLALGWTVVGYFSLLDLGLGRALTMHIARYSQGEESLSIAALARTGRRLMLGLGVLWTLVLLALFPLISGRWPVLSMQTEGPATACMLLVLCIPFTLWLNSSTSILEAESRFVNVNAVRIPLGIATYAGPLIASIYTRDIGWIFGSLLLTRAIAASVLAWQVRDRFVPAAGRLPSSDVHGLLKFGGWMTVTQVVGPAFVYFDRFAIAAVISAAAVTHYTVPFDVLTRLPLFSIAIMSVLFPIFIQTRSMQDDRPTASAYSTARKTLHLLLVAWVPSMALAALLGPGLLHLWVGDELASSSAPVWQWLIVGVAVNGLAHLPLTLLQSKGRTDVVAWLCLLELPPYLLAVWIALQSHGITGAAVVWTVRVTIDAILLHICARKIAPHWQQLLRISLPASLAIAGALGVLAWSRS